MVKKSQNKSRRKYNTKKRKAIMRKGSRLIFSVGLTAIVLVVATYAWFVGITTVSVNSFEVTIASTEGLSLSLDGLSFTEAEENLIVNKNVIEGSTSFLTHDNTIRLTTTYPAANGNGNHWASASDNSAASKKGLEPLSNAGALDTTTSHVKFFTKSMMTPNDAGYKVASSLIDVTDSNHNKGFIVFDLFIKNQSRGTYVTSYDHSNDEAIFLTENSSVTYDASGSGSYSDGDGIQNSLRIGFYELGRIEFVSSPDNARKALIQGMDCSSSDAAITNLCTQTTGAGFGITWSIWEPNDTAHNARTTTRFSNLCRQRNSTTGAVSSPAVTCSPVPSDGTYSKTYAFNQAVSATASPDANIYDGHNGYTNSSMTDMSSLVVTDTQNTGNEANRPTILYVAPQSITKVRVYIWLEGQDLDNFDLSEAYDTISIAFGVSKDRYEAINATPSPTTTP